MEDPGWIAVEAESEPPEGGRRKPSEDPGKRCPDTSRGRGGQGAEL